MNSFSNACNIIITEMEWWVLWDFYGILVYWNWGDVFVQAEFILLVMITFALRTFPYPWFFSTTAFQLGLTTGKPLEIYWQAIIYFWCFSCLSELHLFHFIWYKEWWGVHTDGKLRAASQLSIFCIKFQVFETPEIVSILLHSVSLFHWTLTDTVTEGIVMSRSDLMLIWEVSVSVCAAMRKIHIICPFTS